MTLDDQSTFDPVAATIADAVAAPGAKRSRRANFAGSVLPPLAVGLIILGVWYFISLVVLDPKRRFLLQPPHEVWNVGFADWDNLSTMLEGMWSSTKVADINMSK